MKSGILIVNAALLSVAVISASCKRDFVPTDDIIDIIGIRSMSLNKDTIVFAAAGDTATLQATVTPADAIGAALTWSSSNESIAIVSPSGLVTAVSEGSAVITCTAASKVKFVTCFISVNVPEIAVESVSLDRKRFSLESNGDTVTIRAVVMPENATNKKLKWKSSNKSVAKVSSSGLVTAVNEGTAVITVTTADGEKTASCTVAVGFIQVISPYDDSTTFNIKMIDVNGGTFTMGCEYKVDVTDINPGWNPAWCEEWSSPPHTVMLNSFRMGQYEVTQKLWETVTGSICYGQRNYGDNYPIIGFTWRELTQFLDTLNKLTGKHFRLPTEAEWEYAARGGQLSKGYPYSGSKCLDDVAVTDPGSILHEDGTTENEYYGKVGTKRPNELGLYDMSGNVWEQCSDWFRSNYYSYSPQDNPQGPATANDTFVFNDDNGHVIRGGSADNGYDYMGVTARFPDHMGSEELHGSRNGFIGFRLVLDAR